MSPACDYRMSRTTYASISDTSSDCSYDLPYVSQYFSRHWRERFILYNSSYYCLLLGSAVQEPRAVGGMKGVPRKQHALSVLRGMTPRI